MYIVKYMLKKLFSQKKLTKAKIYRNSDFY